MSLSYREYKPVEDRSKVLALDIREIEKREGWATTDGLPTEENLALSLDSSQYLWVLTYNDIVCGVFGLAIVEGIGIPWFVSNEVPFLEGVPRHSMLRASKDILRFMLSKVDVLTNIISTENTVSIRWLQWLGFEFDFKRTFTFDYDPDLQFARFRKENCSI